MEVMVFKWLRRGFHFISWKIKDEIKCHSLIKRPMRKPRPELHQYTNMWLQVFEMVRKWETPEEEADQETMSSSPFLCTRPNSWRGYLSREDTAITKTDTIHLQPWWTDACSTKKCHEIWYVGTKAMPKFWKFSKHRRSNRSVTTKIDV